jgi:DNA-binding PadR family transcriptional regulator
VDGKKDVWRGTLALRVLRTLEISGSQHGRRLARRIERTGGGLQELNHQTPYTALLKLEQEGYACSPWGRSEDSRKAEFNELTRAGQRQECKATAGWEQTSEIPARLLAPVRGA